MFNCGQMGHRPTCCQAKEDLVYGLEKYHQNIMCISPRQTVHDGRQFMKWIDPKLGVPLPERDYGGNCLIYDPGNVTDPFHNIWVRPVPGRHLESQWPPVITDLPRRGSQHMSCIPFSHPLCTNHRPLTTSDRLTHRGCYFLIRECGVWLGSLPTGHLPAHTPTVQLSVLYIVSHLM